MALNHFISAGFFIIQKNEKQGALNSLKLLKHFINISDSS